MRSNIRLISTAIIVAALALPLLQQTAQTAGNGRYSDLVECLPLNDKDRLDCFDQVANALKNQSGAAGQGAESGKELMIALINNQMIEDRTSSQIGGLSVPDEPAAPNPRDGSFNLNAERFVQCLLEQNDNVRASCMDEVVRNGWPH